MTVEMFREKYKNILSKIPPNLDFSFLVEVYRLGLFRMLENLPPFPVGKFCEYEDGTIKFQNRKYYDITQYPANWFENKSTHDKFIGNVWLFNNLWEYDNIDMYQTHSEKLSYLFAIGHKYWEDIEVADVNGEFYYILDGCHRVYDSYLLGVELKVRGYEKYKML